MTINVERLSILLERGDDARAEAAQASKHLQDALVELREHNNTHDALVRRLSGRSDVTAAQEAQVAAGEAARSALAARVERRRAALPALERRASLWADYCQTLRTFAQRRGVQL